MSNKKTYYGPTNDKVFKAVVTRHKKVLKKIIETVLNKEIEIVAIKNSERPIDNIHIRQKIVDVLVKTKDEYIHIELNVHNKEYYKVRNSSYIFNTYSNSVETGKSYTEEINFIGIDITFGLKKDKLIDHYYLMSETKEKYVKNIEIIEVNMDKMLKLWYSQNEEKNKYKYLTMIGLKREELKELSRSDEIVKEFNEEVEKLNEDPVFVSRITPEQDEEFIRNSEIYYATKKGHESGLKEGIEQGIEQNNLENAKKMLELNISIEDIIKVTGLTKEQLEQLK